MNLIDCREVREKILTEAKLELTKIYAVTGKYPTLAVIQVEGDPASDVYIRNKIKTCKEVGIKCTHLKLPNSISFETLSSQIQNIVNDPKNDGVMLQLPLPDHLKDRQQELLDLIPYYKDIDGLSTVSIGRLWTDQECLVPCTAQGVMRLLPEDLSGKDVTIVGRSNLVGKPLVKLLENRNATVTLCHSKTKDLDICTGCADIVISAIGKPKFFNRFYADYLHGKQTWVDVGINRDENNKLCGDIDINDLEKSDLTVTPVPGGVGLLTTACLILNVVKAYKMDKPDSEEIREIQKLRKQNLGLTRQVSNLKEKVDNYYRGIR